jgi:TRAP-type C4-dicarboxylate transport system substrate-binding protein
MSVNYSIESFRQNVYDLINKSQMPIGIAYFVCKDVFADIAAAYQSAVQQEAQEMTKATPTEVNDNEENI